MDFNFTEEQQLMIDSVKEYCEQYFTEEQVREYYEKKEIPVEATKAWVEAGFGLLGIAEEHGGVPADNLTQALVLEAVYHYSGCSVPYINNSVAMFDITEFGNAEQIEAAVNAYLETGNPPLSFAFSEPEAGSDNMNMSTITRKQENGTYILSGSKTFVTQGDKFPQVLVVSKDEDPSRTNTSMSMWLVPLDTPGVSTSPLHKIGQEVQSFCEMYFDDVVLTEDMRVGEEGKAFYNLMRGLEAERLFLVAQSLGLAQACMDDAAKYANERICFGKPIANLQLIQEYLVDMEYKLESVRTMLYKALWDLDNGNSVRISSALLKRHGARQCFEVADMAMQIMGGIGYTSETRVSRMWRDIRGNRFAAGTDEVMVHAAGRQVAKKYAK